mgnify:FL=1
MKVWNSESRKVLWVVVFVSVGIAQIFFSTDQAVADHFAPISFPESQSPEIRSLAAKLDWEPIPQKKSAVMRPTLKNAKLVHLINLKMGRASTLALAMESLKVTYKIATSALSEEELVNDVFNNPGKYLPSRQ